MKSEKGITLISTIIYMLAATIVMGIIVAVSSGTIKNFGMVSKNTTKLTEMNKINMYMLTEVNNINNKVTLVNSTGTYIEFSNGSKYTFENNILYKDTYKIAENIQNCTFSVDQQNGRVVLIVSLQMDGKTEQNRYVF